MHVQKKGPSIVFEHEPTHNLKWTFTTEKQQYASSNTSNAAAKMQINPLKTEAMGIYIRTFEKRT